MIKMKTCPLCNNKLVIKYPTPPDTITRLICSTHIAGSKLSHYYIECGLNKVEVVHVPPYSLINNSETERTDVYPFDVNRLGQITKQKKIISLPRFTLCHQDKLPDKIKLYVLFS